MDDIKSNEIKWNEMSFDNIPQSYTTTYNATHR